MRFALIGSVSSSAAALRGLRDGGAEIVAVAGLAPEAARDVSDYCHLRSLAEGYGWPYMDFRRVAEPGLTAFLAAARPDLLFVIGLSQLVPAEMFGLAQIGLVGFHPTPLPEGRGRAPVAWTILLDRPAAVNLFWLTAEADAGDLLVQTPVEVRPDDYAQDLIDRTNVALAEVVRELVPRLVRGERPRLPQDHARATWYGRRGPEDGLLDWAQPAADLFRLIRAASRPYPGAYTWLDVPRGEPQCVRVWRAAWPDRCDHVGTTGQIVRVEPERGVLVQCGRPAAAPASASGSLLWLTDLADAEGQPLPIERLRAGRRFLSDEAARLRSLEARLAALKAVQR